MHVTSTGFDYTCCYRQAVANFGAKFPAPDIACPELEFFHLGARVSTFPPTVAHSGSYGPRRCRHPGRRWECPAGRSEGVQETVCSVCMRALSQTQVQGQCAVVFDVENSRLRDGLIWRLASADYSCAQSLQLHMANLLISYSSQWTW